MERFIKKHFLILTTLVFIFSLFVSLVVMSPVANAQVYNTPTLSNVQFTLNSGDSYFVSYDSIKDFCLSEGGNSSFGFRIFFWDGMDWDSGGGGVSSGVDRCDDSRILGTNGYIANFDEGTGYYSFAFCFPAGTCSSSVHEEWDIYGYAYYDGTPSPVGFVSSSIITSLNSPEFNELLATTTVNFDVDYRSASPTPSEVCIDIRTSWQSLFPLCGEVNQSGDLNFSTSTVLQQGTHYWSAYLLDGDGQIINRYGNWEAFHVIQRDAQLFEGPEDLTEFINAAGYPTATTTPGPVNPQGIYCPEPDYWISVDVLVYGACELVVFLFVPPQWGATMLEAQGSILANKFPFNMVAQVHNAFEEGYTQVDTEPQALDLTLYGNTITIMSPETYYSLVGEDTAGTLRYLMALALWFFLALWLFTYAIGYIASMIGANIQEFNKTK